MLAKAPLNTHVRIPNVPQGWAMRTADGLVQHAPIGPASERLGYEKLLPRGVQVGVPGHDRAHTRGPGLGAESPYGILLAPVEVNRSLQAGHIERFIGDIRDAKEKGVELSLKTVTTPQANDSRRLGEITYDVMASRNGEKPRSILTCGLTVEPGGRVLLHEPSQSPSFDNYLKPAPRRRPDGSSSA